MHIDRISNPTSYMEHLSRRPIATGDLNGAFSRKSTEGFAHPFECTKSEENRIKNELNVLKVDRDTMNKKLSEHEKNAKHHQQNGDMKQVDLPTDLSNKRTEPKDSEKPDESVDGNHSMKESPVESLHVNGKRSQKNSTDFSSSSPDPLRCSQCGLVLPNIEAFRDHLRNHLVRGELKNFVCFQCGLTFSNQNEYELHFSSHFLISTTEYICKFGCNKQFTNSENMQKHLFEAHAQNVWKCSICYEQFESKVAIQIHFAMVHSNKEDSFRCSSCMEVFETENEFKNHVRTQHSLMFSLPNLQCSLCRAICSSELEMHFHMATHSRQYRCTLCSEAFHVEFLLEQHMQAHHSHHSSTEKDSIGAYKIDNLNNNLFDYNYATTKKLYPFGSTSASTKLYDPLHIQTSTSASPLKLPSSFHELYDNIGKSFGLSKHFSNISKTFSEHLDHTQAFTKHFSEHATDIPHFVNMYRSDYATKSFRSNPLLFLPPPTPESHNGEQYAEKKKHSDSQITCNICERNDFQSELEMLTHQKITHNVKTGVSLMCAYCNENFRSR